MIVKQPPALREAVLSVKRGGMRKNVAKNVDIRLSVWYSFKALLKGGVIFWRAENGVLPFWTAVAGRKNYGYYERVKS